VNETGLPVVSSRTTEISREMNSSREELIYILSGAI
jgi:hypothetical protein